jgi:hypothetical protein
MGCGASAAAVYAVEMEAYRRTCAANAEVRLRNARQRQFAGRAGRWALPLGPDPVDPPRPGRG